MHEHMPHATLRTVQQNCRGKATVACSVNNLGKPLLPQISYVHLLCVPTNKDAMTTGHTAYYIARIHLQNKFSAHCRQGRSVQQELQVTAYKFESLGMLVVPQCKAPQ
jgi:hypothetical protein